MIDEELKLPPIIVGELPSFLAKKGTWPEPVEAIFDPSNLFYHTLLDFAANHDVVPQGDKKPYFVVTFKYDFLGFEKTKESWKIVFKIRENIALTMMDDGKSINIPDLSRVFMRDLRFQTGVEVLKLVDVKPVEEIEIKCGPGRKITEKVWHFVDEPIPLKK